MSRRADWTVGNLRKVAKRQAKVMPKGGKALTVSEQLRRFMAGSEMARVDRGEITPTQYVRYRESILRKLGIE